VNTEEGFETTGRKLNLLQLLLTLSFTPLNKQGMVRWDWVSTGMVDINCEFDATTGN
jgi:hypothetical protein